MLCTSYFCIFGIHHDDLSHIGVGIGESDVLLPLWGDGNTGDTGISLTSLYGSDDGIKLHIKNLDIHAQHIADGIRHIYINTHNLTILVVLEWFEGGIGGKAETLLQSELLQRFRNILLHIRSLRRISHGNAPFQMAVDDGIDDAIRLQDTDGMIDRLLQFGMILCHTDGERGGIEGFRQNAERRIHPLECLGWCLIGHHTVDFTLEERLNGISSLVESFYLGAISFLFQLCGKAVAGGT